jgi:hypothetical protein
MFRNCRVPGSRSNHYAAVFSFRDVARKACDVNQGGRTLQSLPHQIDEIRAAAQVLRVVYAALPYSVCDVGRARISETVHLLVPANSVIASTIPL